jgi:hypothetical protein
VWDRIGIGIFLIVAIAIITFGIIGLATFMEKLYKRGTKR